MTPAETTSTIEKPATQKDRSRRRSNVSLASRPPGLVRGPSGHVISQSILQDTRDSAPNDHTRTRPIFGSIGPSVEPTTHGDGSGPRSSMPLPASKPSGPKKWAASEPAEPIQDSTPSGLPTDAFPSLSGPIQAPGDAGASPMPHVNRNPPSKIQVHPLSKYRASNSANPKTPSMTKNQRDPPSSTPTLATPKSNPINTAEESVTHKNGSGRHDGTPTASVRPLGYTRTDHPGIRPRFTGRSFYDDPDEDGWGSSEHIQDSFAFLDDEDYSYRPSGYMRYPFSLLDDRVFFRFLRLMRYSPPEPPEFTLDTFPLLSGPSSAPGDAKTPPVSHDRVGSASLIHGQTHPLSKYRSINAAKKQTPRVDGDRHRDGPVSAWSSGSNQEALANVKAPPVLPQADQSYPPLGGHIPTPQKPTVDDWQYFERYDNTSSHPSQRLIQGAPRLIRAPPISQDQRDLPSSSHSLRLPKSGSIDTTGDSGVHKSVGEHHTGSSSTPNATDSTPLETAQGVPPRPPGLTWPASIKATRPSWGQRNPASSGHTHPLGASNSTSSTEKLAIRGDGGRNRSGSASTARSGVSAQDLPGKSRMRSEPNDPDDTTQPRTTNLDSRDHLDYIPSKSTGSSTEAQDEFARLQSKLYHMEVLSAKKLIQFNDTLRAKEELIAELQEQRKVLRQDIEKSATEELDRFNAALRTKDDIIAGLKEQRTALRQATEKTSAEELARFNAVIRAKDDIITQLQKQKTELQRTTEKSAAELVRVNTVLRAKDSAITELKALQQLKEKSVAEELARSNAALRAKDDIITNLGEEKTALQQDTEKSAAEELTRFNARLRAKDDLIAELKEQGANPRQVRHLTQNDRCHAANVRRLVEALNYEILLVATAVAQYLGEKVSGSGKAGLDKEDKSNAVEQVNEIVGERLCRELGGWNHKEDFTLLQLALQATLCQSCKHFIELWDDGVFTGLSDYLTHIYQTMRSTESQPVFAQWRTLTQRQINSIVEQECLESNFTPSLTESILRVAIVANIQHHDLASLLEPILSEKLKNLQLHMNSIKTAVMLDFVSGDFKLVSVSPGRTFEEASMMDMVGSDKDVGQLGVACTTGLGLRLTKKVEKEEESVDLLLTQVLLESSLDEFLL